jgi:cysteine desulfuration protein SufE
MPGQPHYLGPVMTEHSDIHSDIEDIVDEFDLLGDWEERYKYLIDMGKALPDMPEADRTDTNKVKGCVSQVWLVTEPGADTLVFRADSDAHIVRGLAALLLRLYSGRSREDILSVDAREVLRRIGLDEHLSPQRSNGLNSMIARIRAAAEA